MKRFFSVLVTGCVFCTVISLLLYLFAAVSGKTGETFGIPFGQYLLILLFSYLIAGANLLFSVRRIRLPLRLLLHYAVLLAAFLLIFIVSGNLHISGPASVFIAIVLFSVLYAAVMGVTFSILHSLRTSDIKKNPPPPDDYRPRFQ